MRITNNMMSSSQLDGLSLNIAALNKAQATVTSGHRMQQASDDPTAATQVMASASSLRALDSYRTGVQRASSRVSLEDNVLGKIGDLLTRAKELAVQQGTSTATDQTRSAASAEMQQLFGQVVALGNTRFGDEYLFGGEQSQTEPFTVTGSGATIDYTTTTPQGTRAVSIGEGQTMQIAHDGRQLLLDSGVIDSMKQLARALNAGSPTYGTASITGSISALDGAFNAIQTLVGDVGAKGKQLDTAQQNIDAYKTNLTTFKSDLEDVDVESAVTELTNRQMAYQAAMLATSKVMGLTLTDYLK